MILKKLIIILILSSGTTVFADDLIVDKNSRSQYQTDNFLRFDPFNLNNQINDRNGFLTPDTIDLSNKAVTLGSAFTQEARIFSDQRGVIYQDVIGYLPPGENILSSQWSPFIRTYDYGKSIVYGFGDGSNLYNIIVKDVISTPGWYHVAATFDGNNYKLFVNGSEVNNSSVAAGKSPINTPVKSIGTKFQGKIDEVRMWYVARTESEINYDMN